MSTRLAGLAPEHRSVRRRRFRRDSAASGATPLEARLELGATRAIRVRAATLNAEPARTTLELVDTRQQKTIAQADVPIKSGQPGSVSKRNHHRDPEAAQHLADGRRAGARVLVPQTAPGASDLYLQAVGDIDGMGHLWRRRKHRQRHRAAAAGPAARSQLRGRPRGAGSRVLAQIRTDQRRAGRGRGTARVRTCARQLDEADATPHACLGYGQRRHRTISGSHRRVPPRDAARSRQRGGVPGTRRRVSEVRRLRESRRDLRAHGHSRCAPATPRPTTSSACSITHRASRRRGGDVPHRHDADAGQLAWPREPRRDAVFRAKYPKRSTRSPLAWASSRTNRPPRISARWTSWRPARYTRLRRRSVRPLPSPQAISCCGAIWAPHCVGPATARARARRTSAPSNSLKPVVRSIAAIRRCCCNWRNTAPRLVITARRSAALGRPATR